MDRDRQAERLIAHLRWLAIVTGAAVALDSRPIWQLAVLAVIVAMYNGALLWSLADAARFRRLGGRLSRVARSLDIAIITVAAGLPSGQHSFTYVLYWFVLVGSGFLGCRLRPLGVVTLIVLGANAVSTFCAFGRAFPIPELLWIVAGRSAVILAGAAVAAYIAGSRQQVELASDRYSHLHAILTYGERLTSFRDIRDLGLYVLESLVAESSACGARLFLTSDDSGKMECEAAYTAGSAGVPAGLAQPDEPTPDEASLAGYAGWVAQSGREFLVRPGAKPAEGEAGDDQELPIAAIPLLWQAPGAGGEPSALGVMVVWGRRGQDFHEDTLDIIRIFAAMSAATIINLRLYTNLQRSFLRTLQSLAKGLEARDEYTRGHSERVMQVACLVAEELGALDDSLDLLRNAALLHDIGKIGVPDHILKKPGKLTQEEWEAMRKHPVVSEEICIPLGLSPEILFLVKHHHERLDGKGYPSGLQAQDQPPLQRILVVADSFDAMRSRRPYRDMMPEDELRGELNKAAGRTMDPTVVAALMRLVERGDIASIYAEHDRMTAYPVLVAEDEYREAA